MTDLAEKLGVHRLMAVGLMECLWHVAAKNAPRGDIGRFSDAVIAELAGWPKKGSVMIDALVAAGWLERHPTHRLVIHGWPEHCENSVHSMLEKRKETFWDEALPFHRKIVKVGEKVHEPGNDSVGGKLVKSDVSTREAKAEAKVDLFKTSSLRKFDEWFLEWAAVRGTNHKRQAICAWGSVVTDGVMADCFDCMRSYLASRRPGDPSGYNPETFLFEQARDGFKAQFPACVPQNGGRKAMTRDDWNGGAKSPLALSGQEWVDYEARWLRENPTHVCREERLKTFNNWLRERPDLKRPDNFSGEGAA